VGAYETIQQLESVKLLHDMLLTPTAFIRHSKRFSASLVFHLSYGKMLADNDEDLNAVIAILENFTQDTYPGAHLIDTFPILDCLPEFLAPWRAEARKKHDKEMKVRLRFLAL
jgi:hypothetical protein